MRPERSVVKKAIVDANGDKTKAASLLGCTRQSLYTWIYQYGLERLAGVRMDNRVEVDKAVRPSTQPGKARKPSVYSETSEPSTLRLVEQAAVADLPVPATIKIRESLWKRMKIEAINRGVTVATLAEEAFERTLAEQKREKAK